ncbi:MAG: bifunctional phosphoribosyl-AMP cyclohydrolase/phosphoribosyl-ATP diphosphatase HisIE [Chloroflexi bacterium]|nr:bifunctional phosphoribosyl-AMP cyclohydrolase/phosphoribosyl-ATP diphosphatase HisIE [Chloroflexota bacterium]
MSEGASIEVRFDGAGLIPAVVQDARTGQVLLLGYMNREALEYTLTSGRVWFFSRSRDELWLKGGTSGNYLNVRAVRADCDRDTLLVLAEPEGPTCHTGERSCFFRPLQQQPAPAPAEMARELFDVVLSRQRERPEGSYVGKLFNGGMDRIAKKVGEEATEVVIAAKNADRAELVREMADLWFHCYVLLAEAGLSPAEIWEELGRRRR